MSKMKRLSKKVLLSLAASMISTLPSAFALPDQGNYDNSFYASIVANGNVMNITGKQGNNILNWLTFSVGSGETVKFMDKNNYLNLVNGIEMSKINGTISGGGVVYLINPYGILFGSGATLDNVGSFVASTRDISDVNQEAFINDPKNVQNVLYTDNHHSRNQDYLPDNSAYVPVISVANIKLTNVPRSATNIVLDSPNGVVLGSTDVLDKVSYVSTRASNGEIGIGTTDGNAPTLTDTQKQKIYLTSGSSWVPYNNETGIIRPYKQIHNISELQVIEQEIQINSAPYRYLLANDINASNFNFYSLGSSKDFSGTFDGMGYKIINLKNNGRGLFSSFWGTLRNLGLKNANISGTTDAVGGIAGSFGGSMSNVYVSGRVTGKNTLGGLVGTLNKGGNVSEIRNSHNEADVIGTENNDFTGGIVGHSTDSSLYNVYNTGSVTGSSTTGGIIGRAWNTDKLFYSFQQRILNVYNTGNVNGFGYGAAGGISGDTYDYIGHAYNFGITKNGWKASGSIDGVRGKYWIGGMEWKSKVTGQKLYNYYYADSDKFGGGIRIGTQAELVAIFEINQKNNIATLGVTTPVIPNTPIVPESDIHESTTTKSNPNGNTPVIQNTPIVTEPDIHESTTTKSNPNGKTNPHINDIDKINSEYNGIINAIRTDNHKRLYDSIPINPFFELGNWKNARDYLEKKSNEKKQKIYGESIKFLSKEDNVTGILQGMETVLEIYKEYTDSDGGSVAKEAFSFASNLSHLKNIIDSSITLEDKRIEIKKISLDLTKSGLKLEKALLEIPKKHKVTPTFIKGFGVFNSAFGLISSLAVACDAIDDSEAEKLSGMYIDILENTVTLSEESYKLGETAYNLKNTRKKLTLASEKKGLWTPLDIYVSIGMGTIEGGVQLFDSVNHYSSDGEFNMGDAGNTCIDVSMAGFKGILNSLSFGLDEMIFGKDYDQKAAESIKTSSEIFGTAIGIGIKYGDTISKLGPMIISNISSTLIQAVKN